jgi:rfaE bifunctional protein kinase chain/domain/rfaE bifunctional protein nucleotidyltransferase chain/domain
MTDPRAKILSVEALASLRDTYRSSGRKVVQCHGCFDIVHPGHIRYLKFAKELGDVLIVSVSADDVVDKGIDRPYINEELRLENLAALEFVDHVCLDRNEWAGPALDLLRPDIYVKGKEYENKGDPRFAKELALVESYGGKVVFSSGDVVYSSTHIISRFREQFALERERLRFFCARYGVTRDAMKALVRKFAGARVLVVGDPILDHYIYCDALGIASESPIVSVSPLRDDWFVGAGALIASQIVELGGSAAFLGSLKNNPDADRFRETLEARNVAIIEVRDDERPVFVKTRYLVDDQKVFKVDSGRPYPPSSQATQELISRLDSLLRDFDALIVTDFGYGLFNGPLIEAIGRITQERSRPYYLDVSHTRRANLLRFAGARLATPTEQELRFAFADNESGLSNLASRFFQQTGTEHLMLTMGKRGVMMFRRPKRPTARIGTDFLPALTSSAVDNIGAGDVFLVGATLADMVGAPPQHGAYIGSCLASLHVAELGNVAVSNMALHRRIEETRELHE